MSMSMCMSMFMYAFTCVCSCVYTYVSMLEWVHVYEHAHVHVHVCEHVHASMHMHEHVHVHAHVTELAHVCAHTCVALQLETGGQLGCHWLLRSFHPLCLLRGLSLAWSLLSRPGRLAGRPRGEPPDSASSVLGSHVLPTMPTLAGWLVCSSVLVL